MDFQKNPFVVNKQLNKQTNTFGRRTTDEIREDLNRAKPRYNYDIKTPEPLNIKDTQLEKRKSQMSAVKDLMRK